MNDDAEDKGLSVVAWGCLLLPVAGCCSVVLPVIVLLFVAGGMPVGASVLRLPAGAPAASRLSQSPTPAAGQAADNNPTNMLNQGVLPPSADPVNGKQLFNTFQPTAGIACSTCHRVDSEERLVGPGLMNVGKRAGTRVQGMSVVAYLRQSIVNPNVYVVDGYADLMPKNWGRVFSVKQIDDIIAYLLTLRGG